VVVVLLVQAALIGAWRLWDDRTTPEPEFGGAAAPGAIDSAALSGQDWGGEAMAETGEVSSGIVYTPLTGISIRDYEGEYVNVTNRVRRSYTPDFAPGVEPIDVWFFGGSTMFGFDLQRDLHTIPSEVVRIAEEAGVPVRARNYGSSAFSNFQETALLAELVTAGGRPDLVVFYDGINDVSLQITNAFAQVDVPGEPGQLGAHEIREAFAASEGAPPGGLEGGPAPLLPERAEANTPPITTDTLVADVVDVYRQGIELSLALSERYGFDVVHFWQPDLYSRQPLDPGEEELLEHLALDEFRFETMVALNERIRAELPDEAVDISDAYDDVDGPVLSDYVHTNEAGARAVAEAMYPHLAGRLAELDR
jgi:lysophospholipase L1-like esterase